MRDSGLTGQDDDRIALVQKLFLSHSPALRDYLLALVPDRAAVDDLLHNIFITAVQRADQFQPGTQFLAWVRTIGKYKLMELARDRRRSLPTFPPEVIETLSEAVADFDQQSEWLTAMAECTEELAPRARQAVHLRYLEDLRPAEVARRMALAVDSVNVMLSRARVALRVCIEQKLGREEER